VLISAQRAGPPTLPSTYPWESKSRSAGAGRWFVLEGIVPAGAAEFEGEPWTLVVLFALMERDEPALVDVLPLRDSRGRSAARKHRHNRIYSAA
jgi:hypothetical protein